jgi:hypothetical protein
VCVADDVDGLPDIVGIGIGIGIDSRGGQCG